MKTSSFFAVLLALVLLFPIVPASAQSAPSTVDVDAEAKALIGRIVQKIRGGERTEAALEKELGEFDALVAASAESEPEKAAELLSSKALLYFQVFGDFDRGIEILREVESRFSGTEAANTVPVIIAQVEKKQAVERAKAAVVGQPAPEMTFHWANREDLPTLDSLKGKVVVLDFWATWCGPCVASFPQIKELTDHYRGYPVEVVGVTSIQGSIHGLETKPIDCRDDPEKETGLMSRYIESKGINWTIAFSEQEVFNPDFGVAGIPHMAIVGPDGIVRHNGIHPAALPLAEKAKLIDALLKDAGLPAPEPL